MEDSGMSIQIGGASPTVETLLGKDFGDAPLGDLNGRATRAATYPMPRVIMTAAQQLGEMVGKLGERIGNVIKSPQARAQGEVRRTLEAMSAATGNMLGALARGDVAGAQAELVKLPDQAGSKFGNTGLRDVIDARLEVHLWRLDETSLKAVFARVGQLSDDVPGARDVKAQVTRACIGTQVEKEIGVLVKAAQEDLALGRTAAGTISPEGSRLHKMLGTAVYNVGREGNISDQDVKHNLRYQLLNSALARLPVDTRDQVLQAMDPETLGKLSKAAAGPLPVAPLPGLAREIADRPARLNDLARDALIGLTGQTEILKTNPEAAVHVMKAAFGALDALDALHVYDKKLDAHEKVFRSSQGGPATELAALTKTVEQMAAPGPEHLSGMKSTELRDLIAGLKRLEAPQVLMAPLFAESDRRLQAAARGTDRALGQALETLEYDKTPRLLDALDRLSQALDEEMNLLSNLGEDLTGGDAITEGAMGAIDRSMAQLRPGARAGSVANFCRA
jgi:hypothetical protein